MKFNWDSFTKNEFENYKKRVTNDDMLDELLREACIGNVRVGELCFDLLIQELETDDEEVFNLCLTYDLYVGGEDTGYGYSNRYGHNNYPYDYAEGNAFNGTCTDMTYEDFQKYAEEVFENYIKDEGQFYVSYSLIDKANTELNLW